MQAPNILGKISNNTMECEDERKKAATWIHGLPWRILGLHVDIKQVC